MLTHKNPRNIKMFEEFNGGKPVSKISEENNLSKSRVSEIITKMGYRKDYEKWLSEMKTNYASGLRPTYLTADNFDVWGRTGWGIFDDAMKNTYAYYWMYEALGIETLEQFDETPNPSLLRVCRIGPITLLQMREASKQFKEESKQFKNDKSCGQTTVGP